jgi:hypothetical protein
MTQAKKLAAATIDGVSYSGDDPKIGEINRRLNAHDELVAALRTIASIDEYGSLSAQGVARAALAKVSK